MQMKWNKSMTIATVIMVPVILIVCLLSVNKAKEYSGVSVVFMGKAELRNTIEIPLSEANELTVEYSSKNIQVYPAKGDTVIIKEYLLSKKEEAHAKCVTENGKATVTGGKVSTIVFFGGIGERIEVYLPVEGMKAADLKTSSGNITADETFSLNAKQVSVTTKSGNIKWRNTKADKIALAASSGNVKVEADAVTGDIQLKTGSGNIKLMLPKELSFDMKVQTGSGNIDTDFEEMVSYNKKGNQASGTVGTAPECLISAQAGSGNVKITRNN